MNAQQLQQLFTGLKAQINAQQQLMFVSAATNLKLPVTASAYQKFVPDGQLQINGVVITMPDANSILIAGNTNSFEASASCTVTFYIDNGILNSLLDVEVLNQQLSLPGVTWFSIGTPFYKITVPESQLPVVGWVGGTIATGVKLRVAMGFPIANNTWLFQGSFSDPYPNISNFYQLVGGVNLTTSLPQPFSTLTTLGLETIDISYNSSTSLVDYIGVTISTPSDYKWQLLPGLTVTGISINSLISGFGTSVKAAFTITGNFTIGPANSNTIAVIAMVPNFSASVQLIDGTVQLGDLITMFWSGTSINLNSEITAFNLQIAPTQKNYSLDCGIKSDWTFFTIQSPNLSFTMTGLELGVSSQLGAVSGKITGTFHIGPSTPKSGVDLTIFAGYQNATWSFGASTGKDQTISIGDIAVSFLHAFGLDNIPSWVSSGLPNINTVSFLATVPNDKTKLPTYNVQGQVIWKLVIGSFNFPKLDSKINITYKGGKASGTITGTVNAQQMMGLTFIVGYKFGSGDTEVYLKIPQFSSTITYTKSTGYDVIEIKFDKISLGEIITTLVGTFSPGFTLPAPWDLLNSIDLSGLDFKYTRYKDPSKSSIVATIPLNINLGFIDISKLVITKDGSSKTGSGVYMYIEGTFLGLPIDHNSPLQKDGKGSDATKMPSVPGMGSEFFDLKLLALGQHVSIYKPAEMNSVDQTITALSTAFTSTSSSGSSTIPVPASSTKPGTLVFDQNSNWLIGADFTVAKFYRIAAVFNDPNMYGLLVGIDPKADYFKNLQFEILYKKINDSIGVYQLDLQLPDQWRHLEFGEVSITLPLIGVKIYTNGNFYFDFGFPASITDFSRSFSVQVFPFVGYGGFYFGYLSGATSSSVPTTSCGTFNPVIVFGLGLSLGVGKTFEQGIMKAGLSLTAVGIFQGVIGFFRANSNLQTNDATYYKIQGTFGLTGHIYGEINFAIISARLDIMAYAYITITIESYMPIPISFDAGVSVSLTVSIDLGLFSISISLHFSATIHASFTIGSDTSANAPWNICPPKQQRIAAMLSKSVTQATPPLIELKWQPVIPPSLVPLDVVFTPHLTISGEGSTPGPQYVAMLYINSGAANNSLAELTKGVLYWTINALIGNTTANTGLAWLQAQNINAGQISLLLCYFNTRVNNVAPFNYQNKANFDITTFISNYFKLNVRAIDPSKSENLQAAVFPVVPELALNTSYNGTAGSPVNFATQSMTGTQGYINDITALLASMGVDYESQITKDAYKPSMCDNLEDQFYESQPNLSFPTFIFTDFIALIAKQALQSTLDYLNQQSGKTAKVSDAVTNAVNNSVQGIGGMASRFMLHGLRLPAPPVASTGKVQPLYVITGQQFATPQTLKKDDKYAVLLQSSGEAWINFVNGANNTLTVTIGNDEIQHIGDVGSITLAPTLLSGPSAIANFNDTPQSFTLGNPAIWQYPGDLFDGVSTPPGLWKLPSNLTTVFSAGGSETFTLNTLTNTNSGTQKGQITNSLWSTSVSFSLQKIVAPGGLKTPLSANMFNLVGADDASIVFLEELISYLNTHNDSDGTKTIQQIQVLYQPDPVNNSGGGYVSAANGGFKTAIVQANLSTETNPVEGLARAAFLAVQPPERDYNTLNKAGDFIKLLWECSIVRSGGFYFYYNTSDNKGLPDTLFGDSGVANLMLVVTYDNLILAPFVNSAVIGDQIDTSKTAVYAQSPAVTTRVATILPGSVGYQVSRAYPGDYTPTKPVPTLPQDQTYLQYQFNLIGALLPAIPSYKNLLPAGPADAMSESEIQNSKNGNNPVKDPNAPWNYNAVIPYYKYVQPSGIDPNYPNPYAGIGTNVQIALNWQDMFGNIPSAGTAPLSANMQLLYSDAIVALSQWPSVSVNYLFTSSTGKPELDLGFAFNTSRYAGDGAKNNAQIDLLPYMKLFYQLSNNDMAINYTTSIENTINKGTVTPVRHILDINALLAGFIQPIIAMLKVVAGGGSAGTVQPYFINSIITTAGITTLPQISALTVSLTMQRQANLDPNFKNVAGVAFAETIIQPLSKNTVNSGSALSLSFFAQQFETAFINQPAAGIVLKVGTGTNITKGNSDTTATPPLWVVRFDTTGVNGLKFGFNNQQIYYFAPIPLATSLQSFSAGIDSYQKGQPYPAGNAVTKNFSSIDMDNWGRQFLQAVDKFLGPAYAAPAFLLTANKVFGSDPDYLQKILDAKQALANAIDGTIDFIIDPCNGQQPPCAAKLLANIGNAQEKWKQQILIQLSNAYRYVASVQTTASVNSGFNGVNNDPQQPPYVPVLYGKMAGEDPSIPGHSTAPKSTEYSLSTSKVPVANGNSWLTYMFEAKDAAESRSFKFGDMEYNVSHLEFDIQQVPEMNNYLASSWLTFIVPLDGDIAKAPSPLSHMCDVGITQIPVPLRTYPTPPSVSAQNFDYPVNGNSIPPLPPPPITIQNVRTWDYSYTYQNPSAAQDTIITQIQFNVTQDHENAYLKSGSSNLGLYQALAQFMSVYPAISADFDNYLSQLTPATLTPTLLPVINSRYALLAFISVVKHVADMWGKTNQVNPRKKTAMLSVGQTPPKPYTLSYAITEEAQDETGYLIVSVQPNDTESSTKPIVVNIDGYISSGPTAGPNKTYYYLYYFKDNLGNKAYLTYDNRNDKPSRTVELDNLDILSTQNAWSSVAVIRNKELLQNPDLTWQTTNPLFIYQTPQVMFYNKLIPLLNCNTSIDIATIGTKSYPVQPQRTLEVHMLALFDALTQNVDSAVDGYTVKMQCDYIYIIQGNTLAVEIPVLMVTPTELMIADGGRSVADMVANGISSWLSNNQPPKNLGQGYNFSFTAYSSTDTNVPILQVSFTLLLSSISA
ncbi:MAG: hypothetical protein JWP94_49 [Mucilaginibacter sp.]|nr:hypothetical protein [Mucilaginibacter sp.]